MLILILSGPTCKAIYRNSDKAHVFCSAFARMGIKRHLSVMSSTQSCSAFQHVSIEHALTSICQLCLELPFEKYFGKFRRIISRNSSAIFEKYFKKFRELYRKISKIIFKNFEINFGRFQEILRTIVKSISENFHN